MSRKGTPLDNAPAESFFGWFKDELYADYKIGSSDELVSAVEKHVIYYNNERPQSKLKYLTPLEFTQGCCL
jgi:transposase InsO family protein